jgi:hypothetical protein
MQLAETIAWCAPRVSIDDPRNSLRNVLPKSAEEIGDYPLIIQLVEPAVRIRATFLERERRIDRSWDRPTPAPPVGLAGGRLLIFYPDSSVSDPAAGVESRGFFNEHTVPACDTWVYGEVTFIEDTLPYIICWIPPQILQLVDEAIQVDPTGCMEWLHKTALPLPFLPQEGKKGISESTSPIPAFASCRAAAASGSTQARPHRPPAPA